LYPHLKLVHRFPQGFPSIRIDRGAIRVVLSGGCRAGRGASQRVWVRMGAGAGSCPRPSPPPARPCAVGFLVEGTKNVKEKDKGPVIEEAHYLGDGLWKLA
ncbi:hypothetical protein BJ170DRAFT_559826, partial [Xylariales sp. AK1849]